MILPVILFMITNEIAKWFGAPFQVTDSSDENMY